MVKSNMSRIRRYDVAGGPVGSEGGLSPSALSIGQNGTADRRDGERATGVGPALEREPQARCGASPTAWRGRRGSLARAGRAALQARALAAEGRSRVRWRVEGTRDGCGHRRARRGHAADRRTEHRERVAAVSDRASRPFGPQEVAVMAETISPSTGRRYGIAPVCRIWDVPRSSFYADR